MSGRRRPRSSLHLTFPAVIAGRNDPCPCGSGKKFKKCHGAQANIAPVTARPGVARSKALKAVDVALSSDLLRFARSRFGPDWLAEACDAYMELDGMEIPEVEMQIAIPWMLFSMPTTPEGLTLAELWRRENPKRVSPDRRAVLDAYATRWLSVWEVTDVERGVGSSLVDLLTHEKRFAYDASSSQMLRPRDALLAFVVDCGDVSFFGGVHGQPLPPREADQVRREARRLCGVRTRPVPADKLRDRQMQLDLIALWNTQVEEMQRRPPPVMHNTDGDLFVLTTDDFDLLAPRDHVARRLETLEGVEGSEPDEGDVVFTITKPGNAKHRDWDNTVVGRIVVTPSRLHVETNSTRRADGLRAAVEVHLAGMVRFRLRSESNTEALLAQARAAGPPAPREASPPEAVAAMRTFRERHMTAWLDDAIPALGGLTPREASRLPKARPQLEILLKEFERSEARLPADERIDIERLRAALSL
jgi:SEC-C motif